jgi:hypothetical protein
MASAGGCSHGAAAQSSSPTPCVRRPTGFAVLLALVLADRAAAFTTGGPVRTHKAAHVLRRGAGGGRHTCTLSVAHLQPTRTRVKALSSLVRSTSSTHRQHQPRRRQTMLAAASATMATHDDFPQVGKKYWSSQSCVSEPHCWQTSGSLLQCPGHIDAVLIKARQGQLLAAHAMPHSSTALHKGD